MIYAQGMIQRCSTTILLQESPRNTQHNKVDGIHLGRGENRANREENEGKAKENEIHSTQETQEGGERKSIDLPWSLQRGGRRPLPPSLVTKIWTHSWPSMASLLSPSPRPLLGLSTMAL